LVALIDASRVERMTTVVAAHSTAATTPKASPRSDERADEN